MSTGPARFPELRILAGRPAWPWQDDITAILLHKANVSTRCMAGRQNIHAGHEKKFGWRLQDRVMFGWDWPTVTLERLVDDWRTLGYAEDVYEKIFTASRGFLPGAAPK